MIRVLPGNIANLIAAGEVVGRPSSVVKELMENSVDAGSTDIQVVILDAGRTLIQVIDNGCGMDIDDAQLCFERHATSKIARAEDLEKILTYGFRGEALASIAAVSEVTLKTRTENSETGVQVDAASSKVNDVRETACRKGCNISVRNLFYNVPARRKFLKSDIAEMRHLVAEFTRVAIVNPSVSFSLTHNSKTIYSLKSVNNVRRRIYDLCGKEILKELVDINTETSIINISGFIGKPEDARRTLGNQYFFVNGRYFRSPYLNKAVCKAYSNLIPDGYTPPYFIFLEVNPERVDVNIHPAKTEIKFEDEPMIFEIISASVRESLGRNSFTPSIDFDSSSIIDFPVQNSKHPTYQAPPKINYDPLFNPFDHPEKNYPAPERGCNSVFDTEIHEATIPLIQVQGKYIITPVKSGVMIINILHARERIFYDTMLPLVNQNRQATHGTLFPQTLELSHELHSLLIENNELLNGLGFDIRDLGNNSVVIYGLPDGFPTDPNAVKLCIDDLCSSFQSGELESGQSSAVAALARSAALRGAKTMNQTEAQILVDKLFACSDSTTAPDGKKCVSIITIEELDKLL